MTTLPSISLECGNWIDATGANEKVGGTEITIRGDRIGLKKLAELILSIAESDEISHTHITSEDSDNINISDANMLLTIERT